MMRVRPWYGILVIAICGIGLAVSRPVDAASARVSFSAEKTQLENSEAAKITVTASLGSSPLANASIRLSIYPKVNPNNEVTFRRTSIAAANGQAQFTTIPLTTRGEYRVEAVVNPTSASAQFDVTSANWSQSLTVGPGEVRFTIAADKTEYQTGERPKLTVTVQDAVGFVPNLKVRFSVRKADGTLQHSSADTNTFPRTNSSGEATYLSQAIIEPGQYHIGAQVFTTETGGPSSLSEDPITVTSSGTATPPASPPATPPAGSSASDDQPTGLIVPCDTVVEINGVTRLDPNNRCTLDHFLIQFVRLARWGLGIVAVLAVLMLVYGGFQFITAGGRSSKVDEGKEIILGTIIGIIISLSAYVIINFTVTAITGVSAPSLNPFAGKVGTVFPNDKNLSRPFSGQPVVSSPNGCRQQWDTSCDDQIYCADPGSSTNGAVARLQKKLIAVGCNCGGADGCFGSSTFGCVRDFQLANDLPPTGIYDDATSDRVDSTGAIRCNSTAGRAKIVAVAANLPRASTTNLGTVSRTESGCCIVKSDANPDQALFCFDQVSRRSCAAMGPNYEYATGERCLLSPTTKQLCGFCTNTDYPDTAEANDSCFQITGKYWCETIAHKQANQNQKLRFSSGLPCANNGMCSRGCSNTLLKTLP